MLLECGRAQNKPKMTMSDEIDFLAGQCQEPLQKFLGKNECRQHDFKHNLVQSVFNAHSK